MHFMKQKPFKNGFKFWACSCPVTGFVYCFLPSGRIEEDRILDIVMNMTQSLPGIDEQEETEDTDFLFVVEKYFPLPEVVVKMVL